MRNKFIFAIIVLVAVAGIAGFWHYQRNLYSKEVLKLEILGPAQADLAQEVEYLVRYRNNGNIRLDDPQLIFDFAPHSLVVDPPIGHLRPGGRVILDKTDLGEAIYPGEERTFSFKARLFGRESEAMQVRASLTYRPRDLKASYESSTTLTTIIGKVPLTLEFDLPSRVESGKDVQFRLNYFSNVDYPLSDLRVKIDYPSEFELVETAPTGLEKNEWEIPGILNRAKGGRIEITGRLMGEVGEQKIFVGKLGVWREGEFVLLKETARGVEIVRPALHISQQINGNPEYVASPGDLLRYEIFFKNIGEEDLANLFLIARLEGEPFDLMSLRADRGDYDLGDNSIIFDWKRNVPLQLLPAKEEGEVEFWIRLKEEWPPVHNPKIVNKVFIGQTWKEFETKINSKLEVLQKGYFEDEVFGNSGPLPPRAGETTTYTIIWQAKNYYNDVSNVKVKAVLPEGVSLTGKIFPEEETEKFTFDSESREMVWTLGEIKAGEGVSNSGPGIAFQIAFIPDADQKGTTPEIIGEAKITGEDQWTNQLIEAAAPGINTSLPDDETITEEMGVVK